MSHILNIKINHSAYRKLKNMMFRKNYPDMGSLIAYLIRMENRREFTSEDKSEKTECSVRCHYPDASSDLITNKKVATNNSGNEKNTKTGT